jgi:periplasmic divalent cation tolerance protein
MTDDPRIAVALVTAPSADEAARIGRILVDERLAACVNVVGPIRSIYRWRDGVEDEPEHLMLLKIRRADFDAVAQRVRDLHPYDVPEVIALDVSAGSPPYIHWLLESTTRSGGS